MREIAIPHVAQTTGYTCGPASLCAVLRYYGHKYIGERSLARRAGAVASEGTTTNGLIEAAQQFGVEPWAWLNMTVPVLREMNASGYPVIAAIQAWGNKEDYTQENDDGHWVVVTGVDAQRVACMDPSLRGARAVMDHDEFVSRWHDIDDGKLAYGIGIIFPIGTPRWRNVGRVQRMG